MSNFINGATWEEFGTSCMTEARLVVRTSSRQIFKVISNANQLVEVSRVTDSLIFIL